jgi:transcriptional regulator
MYLPKANEETDIGVLHALMRAHPLGTWVALSDGELIANHIPFVLDDKRGEHGTLIGHVARANAIWQTYSRDVPSIVTFQGTQTYITPSWYPGKHAHGKEVPTWNYAVVHAYGMPQVIEDKDWLLRHVTQLSDAHEANQALPWKVSDAPVDYIDRLLNAIVGIEIPISKLIGKWKVSQNRFAADRLGVIAGLTSQGDERSLAMADMVERAMLNKPHNPK